MRAYPTFRRRSFELLTPYGLAGGGLLAGLSFLYVLVTDVGFVGTGLPGIELLLLAVPAVGLLYTAYWLHAGAFDPAQVWAIGSFAIGGVVIGTLLTALLLAAVSVPDVTPLAAFLLFVGVGTEGALLGVLGGVVTVADPFEMRGQSTVQQLETVNRLLCHNIRNRITIVNGELARLDGDDERVETIRAQQEAIVDLLEDAEVVRSAVIEGTDLSEVDLVAVVETQLELLEESHDVSIDADLPESSAVLADDLAAAVVENLLHNAVVHSDQPTPTVEVTLERDDRYVHLRVADDGPGIPDDQKDDVLDPETGSGIGLYLVDTLVTRYGGEVRVADNDPRGAAFVVTFRRPA